MLQGLKNLLHTDLGLGCAEVEQRKLPYLFFLMCKPYFPALTKNVCFGNFRLILLYCCALVHQNNVWCLLVLPNYSFLHRTESAERASELPVYILRHEEASLLSLVSH